MTRNYYKYKNKKSYYDYTTKFSGKIDMQNPLSGTLASILRRVPSRSFRIARCSFSSKNANACVDRPPSEGAPCESAGPSGAFSNAW